MIGRWKNIIGKRPENMNVENLSYSQAGEDRVLVLLFYKLGIKRPFFIDVGAHHPTHFNNTYLFYLSGATGINIEPDERLLQLFNTTRHKDLNLNMGIGLTSGRRDFYLMSTPSLNTFSKEEAERMATYPAHSIKETKSVRLEPLQFIIDTYVPDKTIDLLSVDVEGWDLQVIRSLDLEKNHPSVICVETVAYAENHEESKNQEIVDYLLAHGYHLYADTYVNSIFVHDTAWQKRVH